MKPPSFITVVIQIFVQAALFTQESAVSHAQRIGIICFRGITVRLAADASQFIGLQDNAIQRNLCDFDRFPV